ncbi:helix-turn-helix domain-containing protein [Mannheimia indoligenes]|uniref:helix-turn-helix domain-containing protein n=1 Tax=Mannheimia indoligenes TaxID=3103145 RepID=UPI003D179087
MAKLHQIPHSLVASWLKAFREKGLEGVKSPYTPFPLPKNVKTEMKKKEFELLNLSIFRSKLFSLHIHWAQYFIVLELNKQ